MCAAKGKFVWILLANLKLDPVVSSHRGICVMH